MKKPSKTRISKALRRLIQPSSAKAARRSGLRLPAAWIIAAATVTSARRVRRPRAAVAA